MGTRLTTVEMGFSIITYCTQVIYLFLHYYKGEELPSLCISRDNFLICQFIFALDLISDLNFPPKPGLSALLAKFTALDPLDDIANIK